MPETKTLKIRCNHCRGWFNSPIYFGDSESFDTTIMIGNKVQCPFCTKTTECNKENMKMTSADGGFRGNETM